MQIFDYGHRIHHHQIKTEAKKKIDKIFADVWGVEFVEPVIKEVEDE